jgi:lactoylglutathione lyase
MPIEFREGHPIVYADDMERALGFYRDLLGYESTFQFDHEGAPVFVSLRLADGSQLSVALVGDEPAFHGKPTRPKAGQRFEICIYCDDVDAAVGELRDAGVPVLLAPADQPWGERMAYVEDPDGNPVMICQPL